MATKKTANTPLVKGVTGNGLIALLLSAQYAGVKFAQEAASATVEEDTDRLLKHFRDASQILWSKGE